jgi:hypothetical protein
MMDTEDNIRSRIEAILINEAKNRAEVMSVAGDEPMQTDPFDEERNLYQRILQTYRNAVSEVNHILEENVGFLSGYYRMVESIKDKNDFEEICAQIADCILEDFGAEYCSLFFLPDAGETADFFCVEGVCEGQSFVRMHSGKNLIGIAEFGRIVAEMSEESTGFLNIEDVYKDSRFNMIDFPSVVRSLVCLPVIARGKLAGFLLMSHSRPRFFNDNHLRVLRIVASSVAHFKCLTNGNRQTAAGPATLPAGDPIPEDALDFSIVLLSFEKPGPFRRTMPLDKESLRGMRKLFQRILEPRESLLLYADGDLIALLPGVTGDSLPSKVRSFREVFRQWKAEQGERQADVHLSLGFASCTDGEDLSRTLEIASQVMRPDTDEDINLAVEM